jgi:hypothetical protein
MYSAAVYEAPTLPRSRNTDLEKAIVERCRMVHDLSEGAVGLNSKSIHRWCLRDGHQSHYATVNRVCQRLITEGILRFIDGTTELVPTERGRKWLIETMF